MKLPNPPPSGRCDQPSPTGRAAPRRMPRLGSLGVALLLSTGAARAESSASADYRLVAAIVDGGGARATSDSYAHDGSLGGFTGIVSHTSPALTAKVGYVGQLAEVIALELAANPAMLDESGTSQLEARQRLDDDSLHRLSPTDVRWSVLDGPVEAIDAAGRATAARVPADTLATVQGEFAGFSGTLDLTVLDRIPDNFGLYATDGLPDDWQAQYFGLENPAAAPHADPDGDGQNNTFEYVAGLVPIDPDSRFHLTLSPLIGPPAQPQLSFGPLVQDRTYTVSSSPDLTGDSWTTLSDSTTIDHGTERTVTDTQATAVRRFYRVQIARAPH